MSIYHTIAKLKCLKHVKNKIKLYGMTIQKLVVTSGSHESATTRKKGEKKKKENQTRQRMQFFINY